MNTDEVDLDLALRLVEYICCEAGGPEGAVLVFLPGWDDINRLRTKLELSPRVGDAARFLLLPLHSQIPSHEQVPPSPVAPPSPIRRPSTRAPALVTSPTRPGWEES